MRIFPSSFVIHRWCPLPETNELVEIGKSRDHKLIHLARPETATAFRAMTAAARQNGIGLHVIWAYRPKALQTDQFEDAERRYGKGKGIRWLAPPGFSEHQTGWVVDIGDEADAEADDNPLFERTAAFKWLSEHAHEFQFELSFRPGNWQGVGYEPWHWRFVGTAFARATFHPIGMRAVRVWGKSFAEAARRYWG